MFNWFSANSKPERGPAAAPANLSPLVAQRHRQIDSLRTRNSGVLELEPGNKYRVTFTTVHNNSFVLDVLLPVNFPKDPPVITLSPPARHLWLRQQDGSLTATVQSPSLSRFTMHSDLGAVVAEIIHEFLTHPPVPMQLQANWVQDGYRQQQAAPLGVGFSGSGGSRHHAYEDFPPSAHSPNASYDKPSNAVPPYIGSGSSKVTAFSSQPYQDFSSHVATAAMASSAGPPVGQPIPGLSRLSDRELQQLLNDADVGALNQFVDRVAKDNGRLGEIDRNSKAIAEECYNLCRSNSDKKPLFEQKRAAYLERIHVQGEKLQQFALLSSKYEAMQKQYSPQAILEMVHNAASEAEEESEVKGQQIVEGRYESVDAVLNEFLSKRKQFYERRVKEERLGRQLRMANSYTF